MKVTEFAKKISEQEGLKKGVDIAQISEVLKVVNNLLEGQLYSLIKNHGNNVPLSSKSKTTVQKPIKKMGARALVNKNGKLSSGKKKS